ADSGLARLARVLHLPLALVGGHRWGHLVEHVFSPPLGNTAPAAFCGIAQCVLRRLRGGSDIRRKCAPDRKKSARARSPASVAGLRWPTRATRRSDAKRPPGERSASTASRPA